MSLYSNNITPKLPKVETSVFAVMSQMAADYHAVNLSQGFPDFGISGELIELVHKHMQQGQNQYAPMKGVKRLRDAIRKRYLSTYHAEYDIDEEITITAGATQAIYTAISAFVREDDEVIIFQPAYDL
ncbi:MAG TPA: aminotransferase class I/II-fold pyridoxal phosphate-dependent enzyme, partial [Bacteroidales bacterium]|nr:aminotransferase class I/II-fold pyridoxal phosphate-dependent enzyme [Bacteroidales bacterium]